MTTYPKAQAQRPAATIAKSTREVTRAHARLDQVESTQSQQSSQISTAQTDITSNTTAITAVNTGSGGTTQENFLGNLTQLANFGLNATGGWTTGGALAAGTWDSSHATALVGFMNAVFLDLTDLLNALRDSNILT